MNIFHRLREFNISDLTKNVFFFLTFLIIGSTIIACTAYSQTIAIWNFDSQEISKSNNPTKKTTTIEIEDLLTENLQKLPAIKVLDRARLKEILDEQKLGSSELTDIDSRIRLGKIAGAQAMIFGSMTKISDITRLDLRVVLVETSQILVTHESIGSDDALTTGIDEFTKDIYKKLDQSRMHNASTHSQASNNSATRSFDEGLVLMTQKKYLLAIEAFKTALRHDPSFKPAEKQIQIASEKLSQE